MLAVRQHGNQLQIDVFVDYPLPITSKALFVVRKCHSNLALCPKGFQSWVRGS